MGEARGPRCRGVISRRLYLMTPDLPDPEREPADSAGATALAESRELQGMRAERDAALEELAFLREQLRSTETFYAHRFELEYARLDAEHQGFLEQLTRLSSDPTEAALLSRPR
jgi:hypothetical protein